jgi:hypothetical protein
MAKSEIDSPGVNHYRTVGKTPTGKQDNGTADVKIYADVNTGKGPNTVISTEFGPCPIGKIPTGKKTGGL